MCLCVFSYSHFQRKIKTKEKEEASKENIGKKSWLILCSKLCFVILIIESNSSIRPISGLETVGRIERKIKKMKHYPEGKKEK